MFGALNHIPVTLIYCSFIWGNLLILKRIEIRFEVGNAGNVIFKNIFLAIGCLIAIFNLWKLFFAEFFSIFFPGKEDLASLFNISGDIILSIGFLEGILLWGYASLSYGKSSFSNRRKIFLRYFLIITMSLFLLNTFHLDGKWVRDISGY